MTAWRAWVKARVSPHTLVRLRCLMGGLPLPRWGNIRRTAPFSERFGFDRGAPIDRYYLDQFLSRERGVITGRVLEIQVAGYAPRYGTGIVRVDTVDIDAKYSPTYVCDLAASDDVIPSSSYDCVLLPNALGFLRDIEGALRQALRIVRPGGTILASMGCFVPLIPDGPDYWRLSADGWREVTGRVWAGHDVDVAAHGNCLAAVAAMLGLAHEELTPAELDVPDFRYPVLVTVRCRKR
jgi:hypothetical protein